MRWLQCLAVLTIGALASAGAWRAEYRVAAGLAFLAALVAPALLLCGEWGGGRKWLGTIAGIGALGLAALSGIVHPEAPSLGYAPLAVCHLVAVGAYAAYLVRILRRSYIRQKVDESFMRLDLWVINAGLVGFVFLLAVTAMERGVSASGLLASLRRGLLPLSAVCLFLTAVHALDEDGDGIPALPNRHLPMLLIALCLIAVTLPVLRGTLTWRALERAEWHEAMGQKEEALRRLEAAERHNANLRWPGFEKRGEKIAGRLKRN